MSFNPDVQFPKDKYILRRHVALLDEHDSGSTHGGKGFDVDVDLLQEVAKNNNTRFDQSGDATPYVVGHTVDGAPEKDQGDILGYFVNFKVDRFFKTGRKAIFADLYLRKDKLDEARKYPRRSVELWRGRKQIDPVSALGPTSPERDLGLLLFSREDSSEKPYHYSISEPTDPQPPTGMSMNPDVDPAMADAQTSETSSFKEAVVKMAMVAEQLAAITPILAKLSPVIDALGQVLNEPEGEGAQPGSGDLMQPSAEQPEEEPAPETEEPQAEEEDAKAGDGDKDSEEEPEPEEEPEKKAAYCGPDNVYTPAMEKKKKMARTDDDKVQFERTVAEAVAKSTELLRKENAEFKVKFQRLKAEKVMSDLENADRIDFGTVEDREEELDLMSKLPDDVFAAHVDKIKRKYKRKPEAKPDSEGAEKVVKFARTDVDPAGFQSADDVLAFVRKWENDPTITPEKFAAAKSTK